MSDIDKLMGQRDGKPVFAACRIDYDSPSDIRTEIDLLGAAKSPPPTHEKHTVKDGYQRKVVVEDAATRDVVESYLDAEGIAFTTENVSPTDTEKQRICDSNAGTGAEVPKALSEVNNNLDRRRISQPTRDELSTVINNASDSDTRQALATMFEILTGDTI